MKIQAALPTQQLCHIIALPQEDLLSVRTLNFSLTNKGNQNAPREQELLHTHVKMISYQARNRFEAGGVGSVDARELAQSGRGALKQEEELVHAEACSPSHVIARKHELHLYHTCKIKHITAHHSKQVFYQ